MSLSPEKTNSSELKNGHHVEQHQVAAPAKDGFVQKAKRHCAKLWWLHLIIFCAIFLTVSLILVYVGLPRIAQHDVDRSSLEFTDLKFLNPTPNSMELSQKAILHNPSLFTPTLDGFEVAIYVASTNGTVSSKKLMSLKMPEIHATKPKAYASFDDQKVTIDDVDELARFSTQVLENEEVALHLEGRTVLHVGALPATGVTYRETTTFKGLNGLAGFNVTGAIVNTTAKAGEPNINGFAFIPNPTVMTIAMGNVTLNVATKDQGFVGTTTVLNMTLRPGNNSLPLFGELNQTALLQARDPVTGFVDLIIWGKESIYDGQHLTYYETALSNKNLTLPMNVGQVIKDSIAAVAASLAAGGKS